MLKPNIKRALRVDGGSGRPDPGCRLNVGCGGAADPVISAAAAHVMRSIADAASRTCTSKAPLVPRLLPVPPQVDAPSLACGLGSHRWRHCHASRLQPRMAFKPPPSSATLLCAAWPRLEGHHLWIPRQEHDLPLAAMLKRPWAPSPCGSGAVRPMTCVGYHACPCPCAPRCVVLGRLSL